MAEPTAPPRVATTPTVNKSLEALRGGAAVLVVASHARLYPYTEAGLPASGRTTLEKVLLVPTSFGRESVAIFFVLSGYLVGGQVVRQLRHGRFSPSVFLVKRLTRFWAVLLPGLAFTLVLDALSRHWFTTSYPNIQGRGTTSASGLACNAAFLMDGRCLPFGSDESLWSLGYEFWFYLVFAATVWVVYALRRRHHGAAAAGVLVTGSCLALYGMHLLWLIPAWLIGVAVAELEPTVAGWLRSRSRRPLIAGCFVLFLLGMLVSTLHETPLPQKYLFLGATTAPLVLTLATMDPVAPAWARRLESTGVWLGTWSFTLYVFHLPLIMLLTAASAAAAIQPGPGYSYLLFVLTVVAVYPAYWLGEAHTARVRNWALATLRS